MIYSRLRKLRDTLVALRDTGAHRRFDMSGWFGDSFAASLGEVRDKCGTAACLAGWCQLIGAETPAEKEMDVGDFAAEWLDLGGDEAFHLFLGDWSPKVSVDKFGGRAGLEEITLDDAIAHLDTLLVR